MECPPDDPGKWPVRDGGLRHGHVLGFAPVRGAEHGRVVTFGVVGATVCAAGLALAHGAPRYAQAVLALPDLVKDLSTTTIEERRRAAYGYCDRTGYGYLTDVLRAFPDPGALPLVKYRDWDERVDLLLLERRERLERRVIVGVGVQPDDFLPAIVGVAARRTREPRDGGSFERWTFATGRDIERLLGFAFQFTPPPTTVASQLRLALVESPKSAARIGEWTVPIPAGWQGELFFPLPNPIRNFSVNRGATDFLLEVTLLPDAPSIAAIGAVGARLDGEGFAVVSPPGPCLVALRQDLLDEIRRDPAGPWARFVASLPRAHAP
jgi:hypothetical protein